MSQGGHGEGDNENLNNTDKDNNSISNYLNTISRTMLICDDEPSPVSSDEVFFICADEQTTIATPTTTTKNDDKNDNINNDNMKIKKILINDKCKNNSMLKIDSIDNVKQQQQQHKQKKLTSIFSRKKSKKVYRDVGSGTCDEIIIKKNDDDNDVNDKTNDNDDDNDDDNKNDTAAHTILVKIQVENLSKDNKNKNITLIDDDNNKQIQCKLNDNKTVAVQVNINSSDINSDTQCLKINKVICCNNKTTKLQCNKNIKSQQKNDCLKINDTNNIGITTTIPKSPKSPSPSIDSSKIFILNSGNKNKQQINTNIDNKINKKLPDKSYSVDRASLKKKKLIQGISPAKKFNRSSLTIGSDKITINLSKYSPCASRLAASSKILNTSPTNLSPDSPIHVSRNKSPIRNNDNFNYLSPINNKFDTLKLTNDKLPLQMSRSLNIEQFKKPYTTPRSRSVGDSCIITSSLNDTTTTTTKKTICYSPIIGNELLSLDDTDKKYKNNNNNKQNHDLSLSTPNLKIINNDKLVAFSTINSTKLETKC
ncbi:suppressor of Mek1 isoform X1 [Aphidius gifuensis]|uniref:suppressor of Mek1 isoform X1 n=1 Tax=Aphidius gifuensis TaxID=684658 RepID=UPI001CDBED85|nr:suppressor of Mek1 isoform X1 [Aphidius gifuensis]